MIKLFRLEQTDQGALGALVLDGQYFCSFLMPDAGGDKFQIPSGQYKCKRFHGNKWKDSFEIIVEGHTALLFHAGNIEEHTEGCVCLGQYPGKLRGKRAVLNSGKTFKAFMERMEGINETDLEIVDLYSSGFGA